MKKTGKVISICLAMTLIISTIFSTGAFAATPSVKSDTNTSFTLEQGKVYTFKVTTSGTNFAPNLTTGNGRVLETIKNTKSGNSYYFQICAMGYTGESTGVYISIAGGKPQMQCAVTIGVGKSDNYSLAHHLVSGFTSGNILTINNTLGKYETETSIYINDSLIHQYEHTCIGDVDIVKDPYHSDKLIAEAFKKVHPNWKGYYWEQNVGYNYSAYDGKSTYDDVVAFCNGDASNVAKMSQEQ